MLLKRIGSLLIGLLLIPGLAFGGVEFDGIDDFVSTGKMGDMTSALANRTWGFSFWMKNSTTTIVTVFGTADDGSTQAIVLYLNADVGGSTDQNKVRLFIRDDDGDAYNFSFVNDNAAVTDGNWHHWTIREFVTSIEIKIDNITQTPDVSGTLANVTNFDTQWQYDFYIGGFNNRGTIGNAFDGIINEFAFYSASISEGSGSISALALSRVKRMPLQIQPSDLKQYLPLDDQPDGTSFDGDTAVDRSSNSNNGTGNDGGNNTGLTVKGEEILSYPPPVMGN